MERFWLEGARGLNTLTSKYVLSKVYFPRIRPPPHQGGHHPVYLLRRLQRFHLSLVVGFCCDIVAGLFQQRGSDVSQFIVPYTGVGMRERVEWRTSVHKHSGMVCLLGANHTSRLHVASRKAVLCRVNL